MFPIYESYGAERRPPFVRNVNTFSRSYLEFVNRRNKGDSEGKIQRGSHVFVVVPCLRAILEKSFSSALEFAFGIGTRVGEEAKAVVHSILNVEDLEYSDPRNDVVARRTKNIYGCSSTAKRRGGKRQGGPMSGKRAKGEANRSSVYIRTRDPPSVVTRPKNVSWSRRHCTYSNLILPSSFGNYSRRTISEAPSTLGELGFIVQ